MWRATAYGPVVVNAGSASTSTARDAKRTPVGRAAWATRYCTPMFTSMSAGRYPGDSIATGLLYTMPWAVPGWPQ